MGATFSADSSLHQLVTNTTANCTLEQVTWGIPSDLNVSNPVYQIGLFDGNAKLGDNNTPLNGWIAWSPNIYIREKSAATSASKTASATGLISGTGTSAAATTTSATTSEAASSGSSSNSTSIGVGVGVGVGGAALIAAGAFWFLWRRRKAKQSAAGGNTEAGLGTESKPTELPAQSSERAELQGTGPTTGLSSDQTVTKQAGFHEMPGSQAAESAEGSKAPGFHDIPGAHGEDGGNVTKTDSTVHEMAG